MDIRLVQSNRDAPSDSIYIILKGHYLTVVHSIAKPLFCYLVKPDMRFANGIAACISLALCEVVGGRKASDDQLC